MELTSVQKLARVLNILVTAVFAMNIAVLLLVPGLVLMYAGAVPEWTLMGALRFFAYSWSLELWAFAENSYGAVLALFLLLCGVCTAVILWLARRVLGTVCVRNPFCVENGTDMRRAAVCCFVIAGAALARTVWGLAYYHSTAPLLTYNTLFVPTFLVAGLGCMVMSALFRQAAELKAENDLTI